MKVVPFICTQHPHRLFAMLVLSPSFFIDLTLQTKLKTKIQDFNALHVSENKGTVKELSVLHFDDWRSKNKELAELSLECKQVIRS